MSDLRDRKTTLDAMTFKDRLEAVGIRVPDQEKVATMMEAARRRFPLNTPASRWTSNDTWLAYLRNKLRRKPLEWHVYSLAEYKKVPDWQMGAPMPFPVERVAERAQRMIPGVQVRVHALSIDDPWLELAFGDEAYKVKGWVRYADSVTIIDV